jgi:hypothetical protein
MSRQRHACALLLVDADGLFNTRWEEYPLLVDVRVSDGGGGAPAPAHALPLVVDSHTPCETVAQRLREAADAATRTWAPNDRCASITLLVPVTADEARSAVEAAAAAAAVAATKPIYPTLPSSSTDGVRLLHNILAVLCDPTSRLPFRTARVAPAEAVAGFAAAYPFLLHLPKPVRLPCLPHRVPLPGAPPGATGGLFLSHSDAARDSATFTQLRVSVVVNCTTEVRNFHEAPGARSVDFPRDLAYLRLSLMDTTHQRLDDALAAGVPLIASSLAAGRRVLVHCSQGLSRSVSVVLAYLICAHGLSLEEATARLDGYCIHGSAPRPNAGFMAQLQALSERRSLPTGASEPGGGSGTAAAALAPK